jgi:hypothetical protein
VYYFEASVEIFMGELPQPVFAASTPPGAAELNKEAYWMGLSASKSTGSGAGASRLKTPGQGKPFKRSPFGGFGRRR